MNQIKITQSLAEQHARILAALDQLLQVSDALNARNLLTTLQALVVQHRTFEADILSASFRNDPSLRIFADQSTAEMSALATDLIAMATEHSTPAKINANRVAYTRELKSLADRFRIHFGKQEGAVISRLELQSR